MVGERGQLVGIVTEVSLLNYLLSQSASDAAQMSIQQANVIDTRVQTVSLNTPVETVMSAFSTSKVAVVTETLADGGAEDRRVVGIITQIDVLDYLANR